MKYSLQDIINIYDPSRKASGTVPEVGQIIWTVVPQYGYRWKIFDATRSDSSRHNSISGTLREATEADFKIKTRLPIQPLSLGDTEELLALTAKLRPCIVLATSDAVLPHTIKDVSQRNVAQNALHKAYLVAPAFTAAAPGETKVFGPIMAARVQCMVYPQFFWLPKSGGVIRYECVVRLDRAFWSTLPPPSKPEPLFMHEEAMAIIDNQLSILRGHEASDDYKAAVNILRAYLPAFAG